MKLLLCLLIVSAVFAQTGKIAGTVVDENGDGIFGAAVMIVESKQGVSITDTTGEFVIPDVVPGRYTVTVKSIGYSSQQFDSVDVKEPLFSAMIFAVLPEPRGCEELNVCRDHRIHVGPYLKGQNSASNKFRLDECNRVRRYTQSELQRLPGW